MNEPINDLIADAIRQAQINREDMTQAAIKAALAYAAGWAAYREAVKPLEVAQPAPQGS